jgi:hypothetical protein
MNKDNLKRGLRTMVWAFIGLLLSGQVDQYFVEVFNELGVGADSVIRTTTDFVLVFLTAVAANGFEDKTGVSLLPNPTDRKAGDALLDEGLGSKVGEIVGDTNPSVPTVYVEKGVEKS